MSSVSLERTVHTLLESWAPEREMHSQNARRTSISAVAIYLDDHKGRAVTIAHGVDECASFSTVEKRSGGRG